MFKAINNRVNKALMSLKSGDFVILTDNQNRENEADIIFPGQSVTDEKIQFMLKYTSGIICMSMFPEHAKKMLVSRMVNTEKNNSKFTTQFTVTIDSAYGITTGVSSSDRAKTISVASKENVTPKDIVKPGHIFPLIADSQGVLGRQGHTEGSVDLLNLANMYPVAVLSELMNADGSMMQGKQIVKFSECHNLTLLSVDDIRFYRLAYENTITKKITTAIPFNNYGILDMTVFYDNSTSTEVIVISNKISKEPLVRIHSSCITGDLFGSLKCDCQSQLHHALSCISELGGILIYLNQEGRNIGLVNKLRAYEIQNKKKLDTIDANKELDLPVDNRFYDSAIKILKYYGIKKCKLISNNPEKFNSLIKANISVKLLESKSSINRWNKAYLKTKRERFKHNIKGDL